MRKSSKIGLGIMTVGFLIWGIPSVSYYYPTWIPLRAPFPTASGAALRQGFSVRTGEPYVLEVFCQSVGPLKDTWKESSRPPLPCDIDIQVLRNDQPLHSEHLSELRPAGLVSGSMLLQWHLAYLELPASGDYELLLTNHTDLSYLQDTKPTVEMSVGSRFYKDGSINAFLGLITGVPLCLIGITCFLFGIWPRGDRDNKSLQPLER